MKIMNLIVNNVPTQVLVNPDDTLAKVVREQLGLTGTKVGCDQGHCGACSILVDGKVTRSCVKKMKTIREGADIITIEGIGTPDNLHPLQLAWIVHGGAQCGFCSPGFIVSSKGLLDTNPNPTREEVRDWFQKNRNACRCTGYKQLVDAVMDAARVLRGEMSAEELAFKMPDDQRIWNTSFPRPSAIAKVTGTCDYGHDTVLKGPEDMLHLALTQAKVSHGKILSIDTSEAEKMPGVHSVLTHRDVKGGNRIYEAVFYPTANKGKGLDRPILCDEKIFQYGDAIAVVCADTEEHARAAADKVKVEIEELPAYMNILEAADEDAMEIHPGTPNVFFELPVIKGEETAPIMDSADCVVEGHFYTQRQPHMPIEPDVGFAYTDEEGRVTIHCKSVFLHVHKMVIADGLGLPLDKIRIVMTPQGGSFGYKLTPTNEAILGVATMATGRPVCLHYNYAQQMFYTGKRSPYHMDLKLAADKDGKLLAMEHDILIDHGAYADAADYLTTKACRFMGSGYEIPNIRGMGRVGYSNNAYGTAFRAYGSPQVEFASESLMDELAEKLGMDPFDLRYKNVYRPGSTTPSGNELDCHPLPGLMDMLRPKYKAAVERAKRETTPEKRRGVGIAVGNYNVSTENDMAGSDIELNPDGSVNIYNTWEDNGQGGDMGVLATAHEALRPLGLKPEQIHLKLNDTATCPNSGPAAASRSQYMVGNAIVDSANKLMDAMRKADGSFRTFEEMVAEGLPLRYEGTFGNATVKGIQPVIDLETCQYNPSPTYQYAVFMAEVEVDMNTGKVKVLGMTMDADVGVHANRLVVDGQMLGGLSQGIGLALSEDFEDPKKHTSMISGGFPFIKDVPDALEVDYTETPRDTGPFGAGGCGELPLTASAPAVINAIKNACGVRITELPALPEKVLAGIKALT